MSDSEKLTSLRRSILDWLEKNVSVKRIEHILGVEQTCIDLARHYRVDEKQAARAGLIHDLAKFFAPQKLLKMARDEGIEIDPICASHPHLLHADVSAIVARDEFGIEDIEILDAVRNHTLGSPEMSLLSCIVFVADAIEPTRGDNSDLNRLRQGVKENIYKTVHQTSDYSLKYLVSRNQIIHPRTVLTRNWAIARSQQFHLEN